MIAAVDKCKEAVGLVFATVQQPIEAHPLGTTQRRGLHIFGTLDDGDVNFFQLTIATTIFERRQQQGIGAQVDNLLNDGTHTVTTVHDSTRRDTRLYVGCLDIFKVGNTRHAFLTMEHREQRAMDGREHHATTQGRADNSALGRAFGNSTVRRHHYVTMEYGVFSPRMFDGSDGISLVLHQLKQFGVAETDSIATVGGSRLTTSARR